jgi:hypothetical protein
MTPARHSAIADLHWLYSVGITMFQRSTAGPMWERGAMYRVAGKAKGETMRVKATPDYVRDGPDVEAMARLGGIERRLHALAMQDPQAARALAAAFGHAGATWAAHAWHGKPRGSIVALFPLVPSGIELVARARRQSKNALELSDADRLRIEVVIDDITDGRDRLRRQLITRATGEAEALLEHALRLWVAT